jgi:hypothetical protein
MNNIFSQTENNEDISGKLTYTNIMEIIPNNHTITQIPLWNDKYKTEWRWRFLKFNGRHIVELSYVKWNNLNNRCFINKYGQWVNNVNIDKRYDEFIVETYYVYTNE